MLVRFYLEEEVENMRPYSTAVGSGKGFSYVPVATDEDSNDQPTSPPPVLDQDTGIEMEPDVADSRSKADDTRPSIATKGDSSSPSKQSMAQRFNSFFTATEISGRAAEEDGSIDDTIKRVVFCALGLNISFCIWGLLQERMLTQTYDGEYFVYSYGLVFMNRLGGLVLSLILMRYYQLPWTNTALVRCPYSYPSLSSSSL